MALSEFELIAHYFSRKPHRGDVALGVGDDAAILCPPKGNDLVLCIDALVAGRHFPLDTLPEAIGHKALAVNLSDIAAMGAEPAWSTLALTLPEADEHFVESFARGFYTLADRYGVELVGGDTVRGPLQVVVQIQGIVPTGTALTRSGAQPGDQLFVTGTLGDAGAGLALVQGEYSCTPEVVRRLRRRLDYPSPRVDEGVALRRIASAAIDISDGLLADLGHILEASGVGAKLDLEALPTSSELQQCVPDAESRLRLALSAGDDYELCFTIPESKLEQFEKIASKWECGYSHIGVICAEGGLVFEHGSLPMNLSEGFDHFSQGKHGHG